MVYIAVAALSDLKCISSGANCPIAAGDIVELYTPQIVLQPNGAYLNSLICCQDRSYSVLSEDLTVTAAGTGSDGAYLFCVSFEDYNYIDG